MSMISEQIKQLRAEAEHIRENIEFQFPVSMAQAIMLKEAADTIEQLAAKVRGMTESEKTALSYKEGWNDGFSCGMETSEKACKRAFEDIRKELKKASLGKWYVGDIKGKTEEVIAMEDVISIIEKHDPSKAGKDNA